MLSGLSPKEEKRAEARWTCGERRDNKGRCSCHTETGSLPLRSAIFHHWELGGVKRGDSASVDLAGSKISWNIKAWRYRVLQHAACQGSYVRPMLLGVRNSSLLARPGEARGLQGGSGGRWQRGQKGPRMGDKSGENESASHRCWEVIKHLRVPQTDGARRKLTV